MPLKKAPLQDRIINQDGVMPQTWWRWFNNVTRLLTNIRDDKSIEPVFLADAVAVNNSIYYSTDTNKLVYKDSSGTVNNLY